MSGHRRSLRAVVARVCALLTVACGLVVLGLAVAASADPEDPPVVTFTAVGRVPQQCHAVPNVTSLVVVSGTRVLLANSTGVSADVLVDDDQVVTLADGQGVLVLLVVGQHEVRMVPACTVVTGKTAVVITVQDPVTPTAVGSGTPGVTASPGSSPTDQGTVPGGTPSPSAGLAEQPVVVPAQSVSRANAAHPASGPAASATPVASEEAAAWMSVGASDLADGGPGAAGGHSPEGVRLLGVIAMICVLGVTAAIIRAIVRLVA